MGYSGTPTIYGEQQLAAAYTTGVRQPVTTIAVGDGNGAAVSPSETQTSLVHEVWRGPITSWGVDPADTRRIVVHTTIPATAGPFTVREAGVYDASGNLVCVTALAATEVVAPGTSNQSTSIDLTVAMPIGSAGALTVSPTEGERFTIERLYRTPFISINSASRTTPPASPAIGDLYIVPAGATGAWATATIGTIVEWNGTFWAFLTPPTKMVAGIMDAAEASTAEFLKWTGTVWESFALATAPQLLTTGPTIWVRPDGNDANLGTANTPASAVKTLTAAYAIAARLLVVGAPITARLGIPSQYPAAVPPTGLASPIVVLGDPANQDAYIISGAGTSTAVFAHLFGNVTYLGVNLSNGANLTSLLGAAYGAALTIDHVTLSAGANNTAPALIAFPGGSITLATGIKVTSNFGSLFNLSGGSISGQTGGSLAFAGGPAFATATADVDAGELTLAGFNFSGAVGGTSPRYIIRSSAGRINTGGGGPNYIPGGAAGTAPANTYI